MGQLRRTWWIVVAVAAIAAGACGDGDDASPGTDDAPTPVADTEPGATLSEDVMGDWVVDELTIGGQVLSAPNPEPATVLIEPGGLSGDAGCNRFFGEWRLVADGRLEVSSFAITEAGCVDRSDWMELVDTIRSASRIDATPSLLILGTDAGDEVVLVRAAGPIDGQGGDGAMQVFEGPPDASDYVGLTEAEAGALADDRGVSWRVAVIDGVPQPVTSDFDENRYNFAVNGGVVEGVSLG